MKRLNLCASCKHICSKSVGIDLVVMCDLDKYEAGAQDLCDGYEINDNLPHEQFFNYLGVQSKDNNGNYRSPIVVLRDVAKILVEKEQQLSPEEFIIFQEYVLRCLLGIRYAHVFQRPVPSGKWIHYVDDSGDTPCDAVYCSVCGNKDSAHEDDNYCPNCGAKMDKEN